MFKMEDFNSYDPYAEYNKKSKADSSAVYIKSEELDEIRRINKNRIRTISQDDITDLKIELGLCEDSKDFLDRIGYKEERKEKIAVNEEIAANGMPGYNR